MIQNEHQYKVTKGEIDKLQQVIDKLLEQQNLPPSQLTAMQNSFQTQIDSRPETLRERMQMEIQEYDDLKAGKIEITMGAIEDLPRVLIQKRIGLGMTQKELAAKLGIKEQMVQRYEASSYESILRVRGYANGFQRLTEVWNALSASIPNVTVR
jgi:HTH-type transcriptional regulator / antitoxin HipB